ncbi:helix-turn-helix domain-containing protein [Tetragenococcus halophilus]|uniref:Helix-turn-helix domain-containing protein n=1 Tax=Tetragenococcus halophilus TaxID=51669 RepID=A0AB35HQS0_TETHA|nr:helix-turn-helix domain-containing protein [Tetragenococcus halophilus]MCO8298655.1 helix-turn-helix domain-containing protein [Tetragenococcus halophilus]
MAKYNNEEINYLTYLVNETSTTWPQRAQLMSDKFNKEYNVNSIKSYVNHRKRSDAWDYQKGKSAIKTEVKGNGEQTSEIKLRMTAEQAKDPDYVLKAHGYGSQDWEIVKLTSNVWEQNSSSDGLVQLYQSKIVVKPKQGFNAKDVVEQLLKDVPKMELKQKIHGKRNLVIPLSDLHFPILTLDKAQEYLTDVVELIQKGYNTIVLESLGDIFHSNAMKSSQTIKGTQLEDVDMVSAIEYAKKFFGLIIEVALQYSNEVRIEFAEGNHSAMEYMFLTYLEARYPQAKVNKHNKARIAYKLGNVGIMLTHGHMGKKKDYPMLFATEFKDVWASSSWLECHQGHYHTMEAQNVNGVIHRQLGTIKPNDSYEEENGFTMNYKSTQAFEYSDDKLKTIYELG